MSAIVAAEVTRRFGTVTAVEGVSLEVQAGEVVGLIGANGAGKTTLMRVLLGLLDPHGGFVQLAGGPPSRLTRRRVGYVPQGLGLWPDLTVAEHLRLAAAAYDTSLRPPGDEGVTAAADRLVGDLPLGLRRRAAFTVALAHRPDVLILDEPTSGVDPLARAGLWNVIRQAAEEGAGVLVSTHHLDEAARCDRIVLLSDGRVAASGSASELTADHSAVRVIAPRWNAAWARLEDAGLPVLPAGRALRIPGADPDHIEQILADRDAQVAAVPATLEEVLLTVMAA
ncbi:MAG: ABC transporter ATP-binding protein [Actinomycetota bacterium]|nr:ABC transporter ATP-binding protein [Actinomycetota bacterium]